MAQENLGGIYFEVDIETKDLIEKSKKAKSELDSLGDAASGAAPGMDKLSKGAKGVASALAMPEVNKLSSKLAQLSGSLGVSSDAATEAAASQNKFSGILGTVASKLGGGYVSNVGSATDSLIRHAKEALAAADAQVKNAKAAAVEAEAIKQSATQLIAKSAAERKLAESAVVTAEGDLKVADALFKRNQVEIESLEAILTRQKESLKQSEATLEISRSEKDVAEAVRARSAVEATQNKILKQSSAALKEIAAAEDRLTAAKKAATTATQGLTQAMALEAAAVKTSAKANDVAALASERMTIAAKAQAIAVGGASRALSLLGGPSGILLLAAAGVYSLYQAMSETSGIDKYKQEIDEAARRTEYLSKVQAEALSGKAKIKLEVDTESLKKANLDVKELESRIYLASQQKYNSKLLVDLANKLDVARGKASELSEDVRKGKERISQFADQANRAGSASDSAAMANEIYDKTIKSVTDSNDLLSNSLEKGLLAAQELAAENELRKKLAENGVAAKDTAVQIQKLKDAFEKRSKLTFEQELKSVQSNVEALKIEMTKGKAEAVAYRATIEAANKGYSTDQIKEYAAAKKQEYEITKKISDQKKKDNASNADGKRAARAAETVAQKLENLRQQSILTADSTRELTREQQILRAAQSLGANATDEQIKKAKEYKAAAIDAAYAAKGLSEAMRLLPKDAENRSYTESMRALDASLKAGLIKQEQYNSATEKAEQQHQANLAKIRSDAAVTPAQESVGSVDPVQQLANEYARKLALIQQFEDQKNITEGQGLALRNSLNKEYEKQRIEAQWEIFRNQSLGNEIMASAVDSFASSASQSLSGLITGATTASEAFQNLGRSILEGVIQALVQVGIQYLKNAAMAMMADKMQANSSTQSAAQVTAAWMPAATAASIGSFGGAAIAGIAGMVAAFAIGKTLSGKRKNGGPVSAGGMYQVGEGGMPEIYQASSGRQFMIPGDNGKVISNKEMQAGGGGKINVVMEFYDYSSGSHAFDGQATQNGDTLTVKGFIMDMNQGGPMSQSISSNHQSPRKARQ